MFASAKESNKSRFDSFSVRNSVSIISANYLSGLSRAQPLPKLLYLHSSNYREKTSLLTTHFFEFFRRHEAGVDRETRATEKSAGKKMKRIFFFWALPHHACLALPALFAVALAHLNNAKNIACSAGKEKFRN